MRVRHATNRTVKQVITVFSSSDNYLKPSDAPGQMARYSFAAWE